MYPGVEFPPPRGLGIHPTPPLWTEWQTDACENITFPQLCRRAVTTTNADTFNTKLTVYLFSFRSRRHHQCQEERILVTITLMEVGGGWCVGPPSPFISSPTDYIWLTALSLPRSSTDSPFLPQKQVTKSYLYHLCTRHESAKISLGHRFCLIFLISLLNASFAKLCAECCSLKFSREDPSRNQSTLFNLQSLSNNPISGSVRTC